MAQEEILKRLHGALEKIETRIKVAEARPSREEITSLKEARQSDLNEIKNLREQIQAALKEE